MTLSLLFSSFHCSSYYAKMSTGISVKEPKNLESKSKMGQAWERAAGRMDFLEAKENESNTNAQGQAREWKARENQPLKIGQ